MEKKHMKTGDFKFPETIEGLDIPTAMDRMLHNEELYVTILKMFYEENQNTINELNAFIEREDFDKAFFTIHTFKGVSGNIGAEEIYQQAKVIEACILNKDVLRVNQEIIFLAEDLNRLFAELEGKLSLENDQPHREADIQLINQLMRKLRGMLSSRNPKAKGVCLELEQAGLSGDYFQELVNVMNRYDFKNALELLDKIERDLK